MKEIKIVGWTHFDSEYPTKKCDRDEMHTKLNLIYSEILEKGYIFSGEEHQSCATGVPVFSDGTCFRASMRAWGSIMASLYEGPGGAELTYMDFYMYFDGESVLPEYTDIDVEPAEPEEVAFGCTIKEDRQLLDETLALGIELMTTDKVLKEIFEHLKNEQ